MPAQSFPGLGSTLGRYRLEAVLGRGGMGVVYRAEDERLRRKVAIKLLSTALDGDPRFRERFLRESRLAAATEHPGIVPVYEAGEIGGQLYIAMRYVDGRDLAAILRDEGALEPARAVSLVGQLADALDAAHERGLIHRDVKPSNALVARTAAGERVYLVDFGITWDATSAEKLTESGQLVGTADYLAPERIRGDEVDSRADVYSLGCVLFECLTGEAPFKRASDMAAIYAHLEEDPPRPSAHRPGLPGALDPVVVRAMAKDRDDRWQTCGGLAAAARAALEGRSPVVRERRRPRLRRRGAAALAAGGALAAAAVVLILSGGGGDAPPAAAPRGGQVAVLDATTGRILRRFAAGRTPTAVARDGPNLWMIDAEARTLLHLDTRSGAVETTATGATPQDVAVGKGGVWVLNSSLRPGAATLGPIAEEVVRLDPRTQRQQAAVSLPPAGASAQQSGELGLATSGTGVWAVAADGSIVRIDQTTGRTTATTRRIRSTSVAAGRAGVWALGTDDSVVRLDERTAKVRDRFEPPGGVNGVAVGDDAAWVTSWGGGRLWRFGPGDRGGVPGSVEVGTGVTDVVASPRAIWLANPTAGTVTQVDPVAMRVVRVIEIGGAPRSLATDGRTVWVALSGSGEAVHSDVAGVKPVALGNCEPVVAGNGGKADLLITSDLPLQGDARLGSVQMAQAITFVLRERGFRAGRYRLAYQSCDDALVGTGIYDDARCAANGRAYARDPDVVAVVGTFNSGCAESLIPNLNRASGGPLPMISPLNTYAALTRGGPHVDRPEEVSTLYPTGRRSFVRVIAADDGQGAAFALFARERGRRRLFVLEDRDDGYGGLIANAFRRVARQLGTKVVGFARWNPTDRGYTPLARRIRSARADAVMVAGQLPNNGGRMIRDLRSVLGPDVDLMVPDGMAPPSALREVAGRAARGVFMSLTGVVIESLPPAGAKFVKRFAPTQRGIDVEAFAVYAAQATETLLDAIGRSDGTRAGVLNELFRTQTKGGLVGDIAFDSQGDIQQGAVTILRVTGSGKGASNIFGTEGSRLERTLFVSPKLIG